MMPLPLLTEKAAASHLGITRKSLSRWRLAGRGPIARKFGSVVRYSVRDLDQFVTDAKVVQ